MIKIPGLLIALIAFSLLLSCKKNTWHLPAKTMESVLLDLSIAESYSSIVKDSLHRPGVKNMDSLQVYYKRIFAHYNITPDQFSQSMAWYKDHPSELDTMYTTITARINKWQSKAWPQRPAASSR